MTVSVIGNLSEKLADHFVDAELKTFTFAKMDEATAWIEAGSSSNSLIPIETIQAS